MTNETQKQIANETEAKVEITEVDPKEGLGTKYIRINPYDEYVIVFTNFRTEKESKLVDGKPREFINWTCDLLKVNGEEVGLDPTTDERERMLRIGHADARTKINGFLEEKNRYGFYSMRIIRSANDGRKAVYIIKDFKELLKAKEVIADSEL